MTLIVTHIIPLGGAEPTHLACSRCGCNPLIRVDETLAIHHAKDLREVRERQGIRSPRRTWGIVQVPAATTLTL